MNHAITRLDELPPIEAVRRRAQGLALLDAVLCSDWELRFFSFNRRWSPGGDQMMASMRDGSGSEYFVHFTPRGVAGKVLSAGSCTPNASRFLERVPDEFAEFKGEPAFDLSRATYYFWRGAHDVAWRSAPARRRDYPLLGFLAKGAPEYRRWAERYYQRRLDGVVLRAVFQSLEASAEQLATLSPGRTLASMADDLDEIAGQ